jgi:hypothetical protein
LDEKCLGFLDQTKRAKLLLLQDPNKNNLDYLNNVRRKAFRHFGNKKEYLKAKLINLKLNVGSKISETYIGAPMILRRSTGLELI